MTRFQTLIAAAAALITLPAFAHDGVHIENAYARTMGGIGASGAVFLEINNHADVDDRLIDVKSDVAEKVEMHTHKEDGNGVMQMMHVPEGFPVAALGSHALKRGGDHVMLMGLTLVTSVLDARLQGRAAQLASSLRAAILGISQ